MKQGVTFDFGLGGNFAGLTSGQVIFGGRKMVVARPESAFNKQMIRAMDQFVDDFRLAECPAVSVM
jgi:hypothetical protein